MHSAALGCNRLDSRFRGNDGVERGQGICRSRFWTRSRTILKIGLIVAAVGIAIIAALALFTPVSQFAPWSNLTPEELAERHVNDKIDAIGETIAGILLLQAPILSELGGEFVEDRIHDVVKWHYAPARDLGGGMFDVTATASIGFKTSIALATVSVAFSLPFDMLIDRNAQLVTRMNPNIAAASLDLDSPMLEEATEAVDKAMDAATEKASEIAEQAAETMDEAVEKASETIDAATEQASETAEQAADALDDATEAASEKISEISDALDSDDCLGAARDAGVPERVLSILEKPSDERGSLERSLARRALDAVGLEDACGDLGE